MRQTVAFIGLGIMGSRMVKNVLKAGHAVRAQNRTAAKAEALKPLGATVVATPRERGGTHHRWVPADGPFSAARYRFSHSTGLK